MYTVTLKLKVTSSQKALFDSAFDFRPQVKTLLLSTFTLTFLFAFSRCESEKNKDSTNLKIIRTNVDELFACFEEGLMSIRGNANTFATGRHLLGYDGTSQIFPEMKVNPVFLLWMSTAVVVVVVVVLRRPNLEEKRNNKNNCLFY